MVEHDPDGHRRIAQRGGQAQAEQLWPRQAGPPTLTWSKTALAMVLVPLPDGKVTGEVTNSPA